MGGQKPDGRFAKVVELSAKCKGPRARDPHKPADARLPEVRRGELFFGPQIPLTWIYRLDVDCTNRGAAWMVAAELWHLAWFRQHSRQNRVRSARVRFNSSRLALFPNMHRNTADRGLRALERAGLVEVHRRQGHAPWVVILSDWG